jgi:hypothetical protein
MEKSEYNYIKSLLEEQVLDIQAEKYKAEMLQAYDGTNMSSEIQRRKQEALRFKKVLNHIKQKFYDERWRNE